MRARSSNVTGTSLKAHKQSVDIDGIVWKNLEKVVGKSGIFRDPTHAINVALRDKLIQLGAWEE